MSAFNRFCNATKRTVKKISDKTEEIFDSAANSVKIKNLEMKIDEQYENLGRLIYRDLHTEEDLEEEKLRIIAAIDALFDRITELKTAPKSTEEEPTVSDAEADTDEPVAQDETAEEDTAEAATEEKPADAE
ncbi:MAG: hypothetical protein IJX39_09325 [Clostridia bacterium]|nr:hypothetical protein [Clostridia bacterium]